MKKGNQQTKNSSGIFSLLCYQWELLGGSKGFLQSPFLWGALILTPFLQQHIKGNTADWYDLSISILPNLLGFTLGGYAITLSLVGTAFFRLTNTADITRLLNQNENQQAEAINRPVTGFTRLSALFVKFIFTQMFALLIAIMVGKSTVSAVPWNVPWFEDWFVTYSAIISYFGCFLLVYSLVQVFAMALQIFELTQGMAMQDVTQQLKEQAQRVTAEYNNTNDQE